jgi:hypothetical protein
MPVRILCSQEPAGSRSLLPSNLEESYFTADNLRSLRLVGRANFKRTRRSADSVLDRESSSGVSFTCPLGTSPSEKGQCEHASVAAKARDQLKAAAAASARNPQIGCCTDRRCGAVIAPARMLAVGSEAHLQKILETHHANAYQRSALTPVV